MKDIFKSRIFFFILGAIIFSTITVVAIDISSSEVTYDDTTVEEALNDLYEKAERPSGSYEYVTTTNINYADTSAVNISLADYSGCEDLTVNDIYIPSGAKFYDQGTSQWSKGYGITNKSYNNTTCVLTLTMGRLTTEGRATYIIYTYDVPIFVKVN